MRSGPATRQLFDAIGAQLVLTELGGDPPRIGDDYVIEAIVGAGGFGLICRANSLALHRRVALKLYPLGGREDSGVREALREARSLARLEHPGIVGVYAAGESELLAATRMACAFVELQYVEGQTLRVWLAEGSRESDDVIRVLLEAGRALAHAHASGVVHRDFKPENVMVDRGQRARVIDFGLALATEQVDAELAEWSPEGDALGTRATGTGLVRGTPGYMAPEASQGMPRAASDQFAFAVVVREALTGMHPFHTSEAARAPVPVGGPECFERIRRAIDRAMAPSPADRFASVNELCDAIESVLGRAPRRRWPVAVIGLLGLAGIGTLAAIAIDRDRLRGTDPIVATEPPPAPEAAAELEPEPEPEPESEPAPVEPGSCAELEAWAGRWELGGVVAWTEYAYQLEWWLAYQLDLDIGDQCRIDVHARKYRPLIEGEPRSEALETETHATAIRDPTGAWRLPLRLGFAEDTNTYGKDEHYQLVLQLERVAGRERVVGGFRRVDGEGKLIRTGTVLGQRETTPTLAAIDALTLGCHVRCRIDCAGASAERACIERGCEPDPDDGSADVCGPPSVDFDPPVRARVASQAVAKGESLLEQSLAQGSRTKLLAICSDNARAVAGRWSIDWIDAEARTGRIAVELTTDGCQLTGSAISLGTPRGGAEAGGETTPLTGEVTPAGTWLLRPSTPTSWLASPIVLVGVGRDAPAFGSDLETPPRRLRAHRRPSN